MTLTLQSRRGSIGASVSAEGAAAEIGALANTPEITVFGGGGSIVDGDETPSSEDLTDYGIIPPEVSEIVSLFEVQNGGSASLSLGTPSLPAGFSLREALADTLEPGGIDTFEVSFKPTAVGVWAGDIVIATNDSDENPFNFRISAIVEQRTEPELAITSNGGEDTAVVFLLENTPATTIVTAASPNSDSVTYSLAGGDDEARFEIDADTGALSFITAPDFEVPTDANGDSIYIVTVHASDGFQSDTQSITVTMVDEEEDDTTSFVTGGPEDNSLTGTAGINGIDGGGGDDQLFGDGGPDWITGGPGNDYAEGGRGNDILLDDAGDDMLNGGDGDDAAIGGGGPDFLDGGGGADLLFGGALAADGSLAANSGNDVLHGGDGHDTLFGADGNDSLFGGAGRDGQVGGAGADTIDGGTGADWLFGGEFSSDGAMLPGSGDDGLFGDLSDDGLWGFDGQDVLSGGHGNDVLLGGEGDDRVEGGAGDDVLLGEDGTDTLFGGRGVDYLYGGSGVDTFAFRLGDSYDWALDFSAAEADRLRLDPDFGMTTFEAFAALMQDTTFEGLKSTTLDFFEATGPVDKLTIFGIAPADWTAAMVEFA